MPSETLPSSLPPTIYVVDANSAGRQHVRHIFTRLDYDVRAFDSPVKLLTELSPTAAGCVIADVHLPEMSGLKLQQALLESAPVIPIVFVSDRADTSTVASAMRQGAVDFLEKPVRPAELLEAVYQGLTLRDLWLGHVRERENISRRLSDLSPRERQVLELVLRGLVSKQIAARLFLSSRTVEHHRRLMMKKMRAGNLVELTHMIHCLQMPLPRTLRAAAKMLCSPNQAFGDAVTQALPEPSYV